VSTLAQGKQMGLPLPLDGEAEPVEALQIWLELLESLRIP
jgi:hypothetical protein